MSWPRHAVTGGEAAIAAGVHASSTQKLGSLEREQAEAFIAEVEHDEPETAVDLRVELIELETSPN